MKTKYLQFYVILFFLLPVQLHAQDTLVRKLDSLEISSIHIPGVSQTKKYSAGTKVSAFRPAEYARHQAATLAEFIRSESALYLKESGKGAGSYLSVRGTSSSHTKITWNDIDISFPTMGVTDFSLLPVYFIDELDIHTGGNSAGYGDGSIGGSLRLSSLPKWEPGLHGNIMLSAGSYRSNFTGASVRWSHNYSESRTSLFRESAMNNYTFRNNTMEGYPRERLKNAATEGYGILQELNKRFGFNSLLSLSLMAIDHDREIQPAVSNNSNPATYASISDKMFRMLAKYTLKRGNWGHLFNINWSHDKQEYKADVIAAGKLSARYENEFSAEHYSVKTGISGEYTKPEVYSYDPGTKERRASLYLLAKYNITDRLTASAGIRQIWVSKTKVPFTPSIGLQYNILPGLKNNISLRASLSKSVKIPTLNDRYWGGNNLYLKPESSFTAEAGTDLSLIRKNLRAEGWLTLYRSDVHDWIRWLPAGSVWRPQNVPQVVSTGIESGVKLNRNIAGWNNTLSVCYNYTSIRMLRSLMNDDPSVGEQLAYQPHNILNTTLSAERGNLLLTLTSLYTGSRSTVDIFDIMPSYIIFDAAATYKFKLAGYKWNAVAKVMNLTNKQYQNVKFYAMPGINFRLSLQWNF